MGIEAILENEQGEKQDILIDKSDVLRNFIESRHEDFLRNTKCLQFIDPCGNSVFNSLQKPFLLYELNEVLKLIKPEDRSYFCDLINLVKKIQTHLYLKFYGD